MLNITTLQSTLVGLFLLLVIIFNLTDSYTIDPAQETRCLSCIRNVSTSLGVDVMKRCEGYYCGQFQISYTYWAEAGKPGNNQGLRDYEKCARDRNCSELTVRAYFKKFKRDCNNDGIIDCLDMAALHKGGPTSCTSDWFYKSRYWQAFNKTECVVNRESPIEASKLSEFDEDQRPVRLMKNQSLTTDCMDCICDAVSGCNTSVNNCGSGTVCGPFAISQAYWKDGRKPGASWTACARTKECSSVTIKNYMEKYKKDCNGDGYITCEDYAAIHRRGPRACSNRDLFKDHYWNKFLACRANQKPVKDVNTVTLNSDESNNNQQASGLASRGNANTNILNAPTSQTPTNQVSSSQAVENFQNSIPSTTNSPVASSTSRYDFSQTQPYIEQTRSDTKDEDRFKHSSKVSHSQDFNNHHSYSSSQSSSIDNSKHKIEQQNQQTKKQESINQEYDHPNLNPSPVAIHELVPQRKPADYDEGPLILVKQPSPSWATSLSTTTSTTESPTPAITPSSQYIATENLPSQTNNVNSMHINQNEETNLAHGDSSSHHSSSSSNQEMPNYQPADQISSQPQPSVDEVDFSVPDFSFPNPGNNAADKSSSFDKVVNDIVGSTDFSKSYPPVPDLDKKTLDSQSSSDDLDSKSQPKPNTNHLRSSTNRPTGTNQHEIVESNKRPINKINQKPTASNASSQTNNRRPSSGNNQQPQQKQEQRLSDKSATISQPGLNPIFGAESLNMSNLFEKGLNESSKIANECLDCICDASSNCDTTVQCISKQREKNRCGLYMISWNQYQESDISLTSLISTPTGVSEESADEKMYYECTTDKACAEKLIHLYIEKHQKDCNNDGKIDCYDIAAIHRVGPENCNSGKFLGSQYWKDFNICYATDKSTTTIEPQVSSPSS